jgi:hypothetical protein
MGNETNINDLRRQVAERNGDQLPATPSNASVAVAQQRELAEVQSAVLLAKQFPRDTQKALDRILNACSRPGLADAGMYEYSRGGTAITGPSIRLAEAMAQCWGNMQFGIRELEQREGESTVEAFAWDIETNTRRTISFQVPHERHSRSGVTKLTDPRDIYETVANQGSRRLRSCILAVIPGDVIDEAVAQCEVTLKAKADVTPERIKSMLDKFAEFGVAQAQIEKRIQRRIDTMTPAQMLNLGRIFNSLKDGMSKPVDWFEPLSVAETIEAKKTAPAEQPAAKKEPPPKAPEKPQEPPKAEPPPQQAAAEPVAQAEPQPTEQAEIDEHEESWGEGESVTSPSLPTFEEYLEIVQTADTVAQLNTLGEKSKEYRHFTDEQRKKLKLAAGTRVKELRNKGATQ